MERKTKKMIVLLFILYVLLASSGLILFKLGSINPNINLDILSFHISFSIKSLIGMFCYGCSFILWLIIVSRMNLTVAMPLSVAIVNTLVVVGSCIFLKERISLTQGIGIFIILSGVMILTSGTK